MTSIERTAYPRFKRYYTANELKEIYTPTAEEKTTEIAQTVDESYPNNTSISIDESGEPVLKRSPRQFNPPSLHTLEALIEERMPERNLIDILRNVDYWTNFTRHFGPFSGSDAKLERANERYLLTTFAYGCNLGPTQAARHMRGVVTPSMLSFVNQRHISLKGLNSALFDIINRYQVWVYRSYGEMERVLLLMGQNTISTSKIYSRNIIFAMGVMGG